MMTAIMMVVKLAKRYRVEEPVKRKRVERLGFG
jgi:hypothetical protein